MKDDIVRSLLGLLLIAVTIGLFVQFVWVRSAKKENIALKSELVILEAQDPDKNKKEPKTVQSILEGRPPLMNGYCGLCMLSQKRSSAYGRPKKNNEKDKIK